MGKTAKREEAEESPPKKAPRRRDKRTAAAVPLSPVPDLSERIVKGAKRGIDEKRCKCNRVITLEELSALEESSPSLKSDPCACYGCWCEDQNGIVKTRPQKTDLLLCLTCCNHLCCGVGSIAYPFGHSRAHARKKEHWFAVLYSDPERGYCFKCDAELPMVVKFGEGGNETHDIVSQKCRKSTSSYVQGYAIRGLPNLGNTCYMNAVLQCLSALGELRERILALDHPKSPLAKALKKIFVEANDAGDKLNLIELLKCVRNHRASHFNIGVMEDSHEFLTALRELWDQGDAPTVMDSIFGFQMAQRLSCKNCGHLSPPILNPFQDLSMGFPPKGYPAKSAALPQRNDSPRSRNRDIGVQLVPADVQGSLEKMQRIYASGYSHVIDSDVTVDKTRKALKVDSTEAQSVDSLREDSLSIEDFLLFFSEDQLAWRCPNCAKDHVESSASQSKNVEQMVGSGSEDTTVVVGEIEQSDMTASQSKESQCHGGIFPAEKQTDLLGTNQNADASRQLMMQLETLNQSEQPQKDDVGDNIINLRFTILPAVLTLHLKRTCHDTGGRKISGHVRFMEDLDVKQLMYPSSVKTGSTLYRLAGVVEHIGKESLNTGHYVAHVRARRLGNQQEGSSCSSSWFRADDHNISQVTLKQVLNAEAYILFYERVEDQGTPDDTFSSWEMVKSNAIVNCNIDPEDRCFVYELNPEDTPWITQLIDNKYNRCAVNLFENNKEHLERLQQGAAWLGKFSPLVDLILPIPVCSLATKASSHIGQGIKAAEIMGQAFERLRSVLPPSERMAALFVATEMQARDAVERWNDSGRPKGYFLVLVDEVDPGAVMEVLCELDAKSLLFHTDLCDSDSE